MFNHESISKAFKEVAVLAGPQELASQLGEINLLMLFAEFFQDSSAERKQIEAMLDCGFRLRTTNRFESSFLGQRLILQVRPPQFCKSIAVVSSRLGRKLDRRSQWFDLLRTSLLRAAPRESYFLWNGKTASGKFIKHAADLFGRVDRPIQLPRLNESIASWLAEQMRQEPNENRDAAISISPLISDADSCLIDSRIVGLPLQDRSLFALADQVLAISISKDGHVHQLCNAFLQQSKPLSKAPSNTSLLVAMHADLVPAELADDLLLHGAVGWHLFSDDSTNDDQSNVIENKARVIENTAQRESVSVESETVKSETAKIITLIHDQQRPWNYLTHWTRRQPGPWIDQSETEFLDELILGLQSKDRSALASLARILSTQSIRAGQRTDGSPRSVCFTEVPIRDWAELRTYRKHRARYDFEPYGIAISRDWLVNRNASQVVYGDESDRARMASDQQAFFQPSFSNAGKSNAIDWRVEREWRIIGDVELSDLPANAAFAFAPSQDEANHLATLTRWPVVCLE